MQVDSLPAEPQGKPPKKKIFEKKIKKNFKAKDLTLQCFVIHMFRKFFNMGEEQPSKGHDTIVLFGLDQC